MDTQETIDGYNTVTVSPRCFFFLTADSYSLINYARSRYHKNTRGTATGYARTAKTTNAKQSNKHLGKAVPIETLTNHFLKQAKIQSY